MNHVLAYFLGLYATTIMYRWWSQIIHMPRICDLAIVLNGIVIPGHKGLDSATRFKKTILRYCLLSWTMMFTHVNLKMKDKYGMTEDAIIEKGLATTAEIKKLKGKADLNV